MTKIAFTSHPGLPEATERLIDADIRAALAERGNDLIGYSCIADGADALFAQAILDTGARWSSWFPPPSTAGVLGTVIWPSGAERD